MVENARDNPQGLAEEAQFVANMKRLREERGWSQGEMARQMAAAGWDGFHQTTVSRIEKGERPVRLSEARGIAELLETSVSSMIAPPAEMMVLDGLHRSNRAMRAAARKITDAADEYESERAVHGEALRYAEEVNSKIFPGDAARRNEFEQALDQAQKLSRRSPDAVMAAYMEELYGEHSEEA